MQVKYWKQQLTHTHTHTHQSMFLSPFYCIQIVILYSTSRHAETLNGNHSVLFVWLPRIVLPVQVGIVDCIHNASISLYVFWYVIWMPVCWCPLPAGTFNPLAALVKTGWMSVSTGYRYSLILTRNRMLHRHKRKTGYRYSLILTRNSNVTQAQKKKEANKREKTQHSTYCLLYTSDAADER